jgi:Flp pilus assembly protein TadD
VKGYFQVKVSTIINTNRLASPWLALVLIALIAAIVYSNIYQYPFVFDDESSIVENVFFSFEAFLKPRSIVNHTLALNYRFGKLNVFGYHLVNVLIHIINGFLVYFLALTIFKQLLSGSTQRFDESSKRKARSSKDNPKHGTSNMLLSDGSAASNSFQSSIINHQSSINLISLFAALIFVAHPIQTQAVTYTVQRYASVAAMFYMGSVLFYLKARIFQQRAKSEEQRSEVGGHPGEMRSAVVNEFHRAGRSKGREAFSLQPSAFYVLCIICGVLAFLSKQNTASLPAAIILVEYLFIDRTWQGWKKKIVWFTPAFILFVIFVLYVSGFFSGAHEGRGLLEDVSDLMRETGLVGRWSYLCTQFNVLVIYIRLLFLPVGQNLDYAYPFKSGFFDAYTPLAFMFLAGLAALGIWNRKKQPIITFGIFWFFITLSVESGIIPIRDALFEHRLYLPMFGFALIVSYLLFHLLSKKRLWAIIISLSIIVSLGKATYLRNMIWQDGVTLWSDVVSKNPENHRAHYNFGVALDAEGRSEEALRHYYETLRIKPDHASAHNNLGNVLDAQGQSEEAIKHFSEALRIKPDYADPHKNLGVVMEGRGNLNGAMRHYSEALKIDPDDADVYNNIGCILTRQGRLEDAVKHFSEALRIKPDSVEAHTNLGIALVWQRDFDGAIKHFSEVLKINPGLREARRDLEMTLQMKKRFAGAPSMNSH